MLKIKINLNEIILDKENPRFITRKNKEENIANFMIRNSKLSYVIDMVKDIIDKGLMPLDNIGVFKKENKYIALDGNRRLLALKIIYENKNINLPEEINNILEDKFHKIKEREKELKKIDVVVFENRNSAIDALNRKHTNDFGGASHQDWPTLEKKIFQNDKLALIIANESENAGIKYEDFAENIKYTVWHRFFSSRFSRKWLGVDYVDKEFIIKNQNQLHERFRAIRDATNDKKLNFNTVNKKTNKIKTIKMINKEYLSKSPFPKEWTSKNKSRKNNKKNYFINSENYIKNDKLSNLINQIKKLKKIENYKELIACSIRPMVEITVNSYLEEKLKKNDKWFKDRNNTLKVKINETIENLKEIKTKNKTTIKHLKNNLNKSILMWNGDLHDSIFSSNEYELKEEIKRIDIFMEEIWKTLKEF